MDKEQLSPQAMEPFAQALDQETFQRVWQRVMPDQSLSPIQPTAQDSTQAGPPALPAVSNPPQPAPIAPEPPASQCLCLGEAALPQAQLLAQLMDSAQQGISAYQAMYRRAASRAGRAMTALSSDLQRDLRRLSAAYFLITGRRYTPQRPQAVSIRSLPLALREQFGRERQLVCACRQGRQDNQDPCLDELFDELADGAALRSHRIRELLEQM